VLTHPTIDQMHQLGLAGMARAFAELEANPQSADVSHADGSPCCSTVKPRIVTSGDCGRGCVMPGCVIRLRSRTSITELLAASTARCSRR